MKKAQRGIKYIEITIKRKNTLFRRKQKNSQSNLRRQKLKESNRE